MKRLFMMSLLAVSTVLSAQQSTELKLWPNGAPNTNGITTDEQEPEKNRISNVTVPTLTIYPATQPNGLAIIMCPGGGYTRLQWIMKDMTWHNGSIHKVLLMQY